MATNNRSKRDAVSREPGRPILTNTTDARLAAVIRRLGGKARSADSSYRLPSPPRPTKRELDDMDTLPLDGLS
jgi:hypothetical protein